MACWQLRGWGSEGEKLSHGSGCPLKQTLMSWGLLPAGLYVWRRKKCQPYLSDTETYVRVVSSAVSVSVDIEHDWSSSVSSYLCALAGIIIKPVVSAKAVILHGWVVWNPVKKKKDMLQVSVSFFSSKNSFTECTISHQGGQKSCTVQTAKPSPDLHGTMTLERLYKFCYQCISRFW